MTKLRLRKGCCCDGSCEFDSGCGCFSSVFKLSPIDLKCLLIICLIELPELRLEFPASDKDPIVSRPRLLHPLLPEEPAGDSRMWTARPAGRGRRARPIAGHDLRVQLASRSRGPVPRPYHRRSFTASGPRQTHPSRIGRQRAGIPRPFHDPRHRGRVRVNDYASAGNGVLRQVRLRLA